MLYELKGLRSLIIFMSERLSSWMMKLAQCLRLWFIVAQLTSLHILRIPPVNQGMDVLEDESPGNFKPQP